MRVFRHVSLLALLLAASALGAVPADAPRLVPRVVDIQAKSDTPIPKAKDAAPGPVTPPLLTGPKNAKYLATFTVTGLSPADVVVWSVTPIAGVDIIETDCNQSLSFAGPAGEYSVKATVVTGGKKLPLENSVTLTGSPIPPVPQPPGPGPNPPGPGPNPPVPPNPDPSPSATISTFVVVEDTTKAGVWRSEILGSPEVEKFYRQLRGPRPGLIHKLYDASTVNQTEEGKKWVGAAVGKSLPYVFMLDTAGKVLKECTAPTKNPLDFIACFDLHADTPRAMGLILPEEDTPKLGLFSKDNPGGWKQFGTTPTTPIIPRAQWPKSRRLSTFLPAVYDQDGRGQCASSSACNVMEIAARIQGFEYPKLSAGDLYSRVNGGRDKGSMLEDNLKELVTNGVAPASMVPYVWNGRVSQTAAVIAERRRYRAVEAYWCPGIDAAVSASLQGFAVGVGLMWYDNFKPVDAAGWLPMKGTCSSRECPGGHAITCYGIETKADGTVGLVIRNSWSSTWGISGDCILPETLFSGHIGGFYAVRVVTDPATVTLQEKFLNPFREFALAW